MGSFGAPFDTGDAVTKHRLGRKTIHQMTGGEIDALITDDSLDSQYVFAGNANDSVGSNNLTENGTPTYDADGGPDGQYIILNGSSQYLTAAANTVHDITTGDFSFTFWLYRTSDSGTNERLIMKRDTAVSTNKGYGIIINTSDKIDPSICDGSAAVINKAGSTSIAVNTWYHIAVVFDRDANMTIYVNGADDGSVSISTQQLTISNTQTFTVGRASASAANFFPGRIDDLRVYSKALSADEVKAIMNDVRGGQIFIPTETSSPYTKNIPCFRKVENDGTEDFVTATGTQTITNKTFNMTDNTLEDDSDAQGDIIAHNGTKFVRKAMGTAFQILRTNSGATDIEYADNDDIGWREITRVSPSDGASSISTGTITAKKYLRVQVFIKMDGTAGTNITADLRFNNDSAGNYDEQVIDDNGAPAEGLAQSGLQFLTAIDEDHIAYGTIDILNVAAESKHVHGKATTTADLGAGQGDSPTIYELYGVWHNQASQITRIDLVITAGTAVFDETSEIVVYGRD